MYKISFSALDWETPIQGVRHKKYCEGNRMLRLVEYTPAMPLHWCEKGHIGYVLEGKLKIEFDNETVIYQAGDGVFIPNGKLIVSDKKFSFEKIIV
ncbi:MAG TPA: cupin domain-containing protein [bacterium]|nr:cupin domain-containing protein [bacterium]HPN46239.1 cupin domain-containing protein [bacterium]